jgi:hypothetical protein
VGTIIDAILLLINEIFFLFPHYFPKLSKTAIFSNKNRLLILLDYHSSDFLSFYQFN